MDVEPHRRRSPASALFNRLDERRWPARAQRLIEAGFTQSVERLTALLQRCLGEFERQLFTLAERAHRPDVQQDCFASRQRMLQEQANVLDRFVVQLGEAFSQLGDVPVKKDAGESGWQTLELVDPIEQERELTMNRLIARGEVRHNHVLHELGYRMAVLVAAPPMEGEALPMGPHALIGAMHRASVELALPPVHHLLLLRSFDQHVLQPLGSLYEAINACWLEDGILPNLRSTPLVSRSSASRSRLGDVETEQAPHVDSPPVAATASPPAIAQTRAQAAPSSSIEVLDSLRNLLAQRGRGASNDSTGGAESHRASEDELHAALGALQQHVMEVTDSASRELRSAHALREELLLQLNSGKPAGSPRTELTSEQDDKVELVGMLFEQLGEQLHHNVDGRSLMGGLQFPVLNMAVTDQNFFETREHPARKLLDTVAAAANDWLDGSDNEANRALAEKLGQLVNRANREPPSAGLYTTLLADIEHHLSLLTRKAQAAERRYVEAAKGREKLDQARQMASDLMAERFSHAAPHGLLRTLLERAWSDVLALTLLRHGQNSEALAAQLLITDQLLGREPVDDAQQLQSQIQSGLQQVGMHAEEAQQLAQRLLRSVAPAPTAPRAEPLKAASDQPTPVRKSRPAVAPADPVRAASSGDTTRPAVSRSPASSVPKPAAAASVAEERRAPSTSAAAPPPVSAETKVASKPGAAAGHARSGQVPCPPKPTPPAETPDPGGLLSNNQLAQRLKQHQRLGENAHQTDQSATPQPAARPEPVLGLQEARIYKRLRQLPFGTWFEFVDAGSGQRSQHKLAWFSPVTDKVLFVTRRGTQSESMSLAQLADAIGKGEAREMPKHNDSMLDRAWKNLTRSLRQDADARQVSRREFRRP